ncbi:hypothetical protein Tco_1560978 [Tanacetum coccineum]
MTMLGATLTGKAPQVPIFCDNTSAIAISNNPVLHSRTKHIDIRYHFIRDRILKGDIELHFFPTQYQLADIFTKPLDEPTFKRLIVELGYSREIGAKGTLKKSFLPPRWRLLMGQIIQCLGGKTGGLDQISNKDATILYCLDNGVDGSNEESRADDLSKKIKLEDLLKFLKDTRSAFFTRDSPKDEPIIVTDEITELKNIQWGLPAEFQPIPALVSSILNKVTQTLDRFTTVVENASTTTKDVPLAGQITTLPVEGEKNTKDADTNLKD